MSETKSSRWDSDQPPNTDASARRKRKWDLDDQGRVGEAQPPKTQNLEPSPSPSSQNSSSIVNSSPPLTSPLTSSPSNIPSSSPSTPGFTGYRNMSLKTGAIRPNMLQDQSKFKPTPNKNEYNTDQSPRVQSELPSYILQEKVFISIEGERNFPLKPRLVGPSGTFIKHIQQTSGVRIVLKGRGSGYLDPATQKENDENLHFYITSPHKEKLDQAKKLCEDLIETVKSDYEKHLAQKQQQQQQHHSHQSHYPQRPQHQSHYQQQSHHQHHQHSHIQPPPQQMQPGYPPQSYGYSQYQDPYAPYMAAAQGYPAMAGYPPTYPPMTGYPQPYAQPYPVQPQQPTSPSNSSSTANSNPNANAANPNSNGAATDGSAANGHDAMAAAAAAYYYGYSYPYGYFVPPTNAAAPPLPSEPSKNESYDYSKVPPPPSDTNNSEEAKKLKQ